MLEPSSNVSNCESRLNACVVKRASVNQLIQESCLDIFLNTPFLLEFPFPLESGKWIGARWDWNGERGSGLSSRSIDASSLTLFHKSQATSFAVGKKHLLWFSTQKFSFILAFILGPKREWFSMINKEDKKKKARLPPQVAKPPRVDTD